MSYTSEEDKGEDTREVLKVISRRGVGDLLNSLKNGPKKFSQLMFDTRLNPSIIDRHLKALIKLGLVSKENESYKLTEHGRNVLKVVDELFRVMKP
ncbi:MAG: helix-turn-helix transcriptional regulator [Archaeoglobaceae archaeon]|nr:helix-turn-helix transcriptional regulator [Archaeoglobaceae archaeon]MDW8128745.1 helix-turn-helix domain-containing protein [Archaeoglobaceae archaeon]